MRKIAGHRTVFISNTRSLATALIAGVIFLMVGNAVRAATITVNTLADAGAPDVCTLRAAITAANSNTAVNGCAPGKGADSILFTITGTIALVGTLPTISEELTITGPASPGVSIDAAGHLPFRLMQVASGATLNVKNLTLAHGHSILGFGRPQGGGLFNSHGTVTVTNSTLLGNGADYGGGGIYNDGGMLTITNSTFSGNGSGYNEGGGIYNNGGILTVINSTFVDNSSGFGGENSGGGGIYNGGKLSVVNSSFSHNEGHTVGGAIENSGSLTVTNSSFLQNFARGGGGIINFAFENLASATVLNSSFSENGAFEGGAILNGGTLTVINGTFSGNNAGEGPSCIESGSDLRITNSTFSGNGLDGFGTGCIGSGGGGKLKGTIQAGNKPINCDGTVVDAGYNISDDNSCGFGSIGSSNNTDPKLDPKGLRNNGGSTQTIALLAASPAVDAIPLASCTDQATPTPHQLTSDQRGFGRPDPGDDPAACDIGAYESGAVPLLDCSKARASSPVLWPPNHKFVTENILGVNDVLPTTISITSIKQDEPVLAAGSGNTCPDATVIRPGSAEIRGERSGTGNGRVYHIGFSATDKSGASCSGKVKVCVPFHGSAAASCGDGGAFYDSTFCSR